MIMVATTQLTDSDKAELNKLLSNPHGLYEITRLKREPKDFSNQEIAQEISRGKQLQALYGVTKRLLPHLDISNESVKYYAWLVNYYSVYQLNQIDDPLVYIYLLCFVYHRYQKLHDNLIRFFIYQVKRYVDEAKNAAKESVYQFRIEQNSNLHKAGQVLRLFTDEAIAGETPFAHIQAQAFAILERQHLVSVANHMVQKASFDEKLFQWEHIDKMANRFKRRLRPVLRALDFAAASANEPLLTAIHFLQAAFRDQKPLSQYEPDRRPLQFIPDHIKRYVYTVDKEGSRHMLMDRYEFLIYRLLRNSLEAGNIFCRDSVRFRSFDEDLVDDELWQEKESLMVNLGLSILNKTAVEHLRELNQLLEERLITVNQRIAAGENEHVKVKKRGKRIRWTLPYPQANDSVNHPLFDTVEQVGIQAIIHFVNSCCHFLGEFTHVLHRYAKQQAADDALVACLVAWRTNMGLGRMGKISDIAYQTLITTSDNFIRLETLHKANDVISNALARLPIFQEYNIGDTIHSSSDGQKFETGIQTMNARYSSKYFGLRKGVVAYTLLANHIPINAKVIGADEHESHFVFDILHNNTTEIQPTIHSTDTHGTNEVNFAILHFFGYQFAPRYRDIYDKANTSLYGFQHPSQYDDDWLLKPIRKITEPLIIDEWDNMRRIIVSLALKTTTQNIIVGKLSSHVRKNKTKQALWEYDNIVRSLYLLNYIDSLTLRQDVQQALNRGESYNQLKRAVSYANFGKLRFKTEGEQQIWNECSRLITNCIIFYNATILSNLLLLKEANGDTEQAVLLKRVSPVAWQHINFYGRYEFAKSPEPIDIEAIVQELAKLPITLDPTV